MFEKSFWVRVVYEFVNLFIDLLVTGRLKHIEYEHSNEWTTFISHLKIMNAALNFSNKKPKVLCTGDTIMYYIHTEKFHCITSLSTVYQNTCRVWHEKLLFTKLRKYKTHSTQFDEQRLICVCFTFTAEMNQLIQVLSSSSLLLSLSSCLLCYAYNENVTTSPPHDVK